MIHTALVRRHAHAAAPQTQTSNVHSGGALIQRGVRSSPRPPSRCLGRLWICPRSSHRRGPPVSPHQHHHHFRISRRPSPLDVGRAPRRPLPLLSSRLWYTPVLRGGVVSPLRLAPRWSASPHRRRPRPRHLPAASSSARASLARALSRVSNSSSLAIFATRRTRMPPRRPQRAPMRAPGLIRPRASCSHSS